MNSVSENLAPKSIDQLDNEPGNTTLESNLFNSILGTLTFDINMKVQENLMKEDQNSSIDGDSSPDKSLSPEKLEFNVSKEVTQLLNDEKQNSPTNSESNLTKFLNELDDTTINNENESLINTKADETANETNELTMNDTTTVSDTTLSTLNTKSIIEQNVSNITNDDQNQQESTEKSPEASKIEENQSKENIEENQTNNPLLSTELPAESLNVSHQSENSSDSYPHLPKDCQLNLGGISTISPSENKGPCYTYSMPGNLQKIVYHSPDSLICQALAQHQLPLLTKEDKTHLLSDLYKYTSLCSSKGLIFEAAYVNSVAETLKNSPDFIPTRLDKKRVEENIQYAAQELKAQNDYWDSQNKLIETEYATGLKELELKLFHEQDMLDHEWQSQKKILKYSKPSPTLLNARYSASQQIRMRDFEGAKSAGETIRRIEKIESEEAQKRMNAGYMNADAALMRKYDLECSTKSVIRDKRLCAASIARERAMKPVVKRQEKLLGEKARLEAIERSAQQVKTRPIPVIANDANAPFYDLNGTPKLKLNPVTLINRGRDAGNSSKMQSARRSTNNPRSPSRLGGRK